MANMHPTYPHTPKRVLIIYNPTAGWFGRRRFRKIKAALCQLGCDVTVQETARRGDAEAFARHADAGDFDAVAAAGGDGTVNEVAAGLVGGHLPLGIIPLGTTNVLATEIGLPRRPEIIAATIATGTRLRCHPGQANGRHFMMMAGVGFDAHVVENCPPSLKKIIGKGAYVLTAIANLWGHASHRYEVTLNGRTTSAASIIIANGRHYGGRFVCTPDARLDRASFQVCLFKSGGPWATLRYSLGVIRGTVPEMTDIAIVEADRIQIKGRSGDPVQGDGDIIARLPLEAWVSPQTLDLLVPNMASGQCTTTV
jgi:YegS/Rv2252/BmrU family lipid kinase